MDKDTVMECRIYIAVAEACWRQHEPSYSMHVFEWLCWKQRIKYPLVDRRCTIIGCITS